MLTSTVTIFHLSRLPNVHCDEKPCAITCPSEAPPVVLLAGLAERALELAAAGRWAREAGLVWRVSEAAVVL